MNEQMPSIIRRKNLPGTLLLAAYVIVAVIFLYQYFSLISENRRLDSELDSLLAEKLHLTVMQVETKEKQVLLNNRWRERESAQMKINRAIRLAPFEDMDFSSSPFFIASHSRTIDGNGMNVMVNVPVGQQTLQVCFPTKSDLEKTPKKRQDYWRRDALHFDCSQKLLLEAGAFYHITYRIVNEGDSSSISAVVRTKDETIFSNQFTYKAKSIKTTISGAGTRNKVFLPGEITDPFCFASQGVERPTYWEWTIFEHADEQRYAHHLQFTYLNEPAAFISPTTFVNYESLRRVYYFQPLSLSDVFEPIGSEDKFILKTFPTSRSRKSDPLY